MAGGVLSACYIYIDVLKWGDRMNRVRYFCLLFIFISILVIFQSFGILVIIGFLVLLPVASFLLCRYAEKRIEYEILTTGEMYSF